MAHDLLHTHLQLGLNREVLTDYVPKKVAEDKAYQNAIANSDEQKARLEHDRALEQVMIGMMKNHAQLFKLFMDNVSFQKESSDTIFALTYHERVA